MISEKNLRNDYFNDSWDISMSTLLDFPPDDKLNSSHVTENVLEISNTKFFGLPSHVSSLILKYKGIEKLYDWQNNCLNLPAVRNRQNLVYSLPTSGGKTLVAEILILRELLLQKKNVIFVLPYVALAQEKVRSLSPFGLDLEFYVEEYVGGKGKYPPIKHHKKRSVYVCTIEKAAGLIESLLDANRLDEIGILVVDEIHLIGDSTRGATLEMMLAKLMYIKKSIHIIAMSATVGNLNEIGTFLNAQVYTHDFRPVELIEYVKCDHKVLRIDRNNGVCNLVFERDLNYDYNNELKKIDTCLLGGLVSEVIPRESCLVFCATKNQCSHFAMLICYTLNRCSKEIKKEEKLSLLRALNEEGQGMVCPILKKTIAYGVAYHHAGLTNAERKLLEEAFLAGTISCICCTSTLAAGVNLPAKRVIILSPYLGKDFLKLSTYKQMCGRAGRMGLTSAGESYLMCQESNLSKIVELLTSNMDRCDSKLSPNNFLRLTMSAISLGVANMKTDLERLLSCTLFHIGSEKDFNLTQIVEDSLQELYSLKAIKESAENGEYTLTFMANAAVTANLDINEAQLVYNDLQEAVENGLILSNYLHLFYLITPYSALEDIKIDRQVKISVYSELQDVELKIAKRIGITEVCLIQYVKTGRVNSVSEVVWNRFLLSLIIFDLWNKNSVWQVSQKFEIARGTIHNFLMRSAAFASSVQRFTEALKIEKFEFFPALLQKIIPRISYCCSLELLQLMQLPAVKIGRAKQLYKAGFKSLQDLVNADPLKLVALIDHLPRRVAYEIIAAAKLLMLEKAETLQEEADIIKAELNDNKNVANISFTGINKLPENQLSTPQVKNRPM